MLKNPALFQDGYHLSSFELEADIKESVLKSDWEKLDQQFRELTQKEGRLFNFLKSYHDFNEIEFIISLRDGDNSWEEDGIWHDDGSRVFAFSLSLTLNPETIKGGRLGIRRKKAENFLEIPTPHFGHIILFLTGLHGFEHKIHQVHEGRRLIIAGWCS